MAVDYFSIIHTYIPTDSLMYRIYVPHVVQVTAKALEIARRLGLSADQLQFIEEAGMLHDIGIVKVDDPEIGCHGELPYICHGSEGRRILEAEGLPRHALVCERHTGVGISAQEVEEKKLPLPHRDFLPESLEERIISYADVWFSKDPAKLWRPHTREEVEAYYGKFGEEKINVFQEWYREFEVQ